MRFFLFIYDKFRGAIRANYFHYRLRNVILLTITVIMLNISPPRHCSVVYFFCIARRRVRTYLCQYNIVVHGRCTSLLCRQQTVVQVVPCAVAADNTKRDYRRVPSDLSILSLSTQKIITGIWKTLLELRRRRTCVQLRYIDFTLATIYTYICMYVRATNIQFYRLCFRYICTQTHTFIYSKIY